MGDGYLSKAEADSINSLMPGNQVYGVGSKIRNALMLGIGWPEGLKAYVDGVNGANSGFDGFAWDTPFKTINHAVACLEDTDRGGLIVVAPGDYNEAVVVSKDNIMVMGAGNPLAVRVKPLTAGAAAMYALGQKTCLVNLDLVGQDAAPKGTRVRGDGFRAFGCKFEMNNDLGVALYFDPENIDGNTASLAIVEDCEFAWAEVGAYFSWGAGWICTQSAFRRNWFHNVSVIHVMGDAAAVSVENLELTDNVHDNLGDGTVPSGHYIDLHEAGNTGIVSGCRFACPTNAVGRNLVAAGILWVANMTEAGITAARPA